VGFVRELLERYPRLTATRLWHMLRERGCPLSVRRVREKVGPFRPNRHEAFLRRQTFAGGESQVDWASFGHVMVGAARRALSAFVLTLSFSRWFFLRFFLDQSLENFLRGHVYAFEDLHGAASTTTSARRSSTATARVCASTPGCQTPRLSSVAFLLAQRRRTAQRKVALPVELSRRPDLRDIYVKPHGSETYDELAHRDDEDDDDERH
jgi:transposase